MRSFEAYALQWIKRVVKFLQCNESFEEKSKGPITEPVGQIMFGGKFERKVIFSLQ